ncbi:MAG: hypothetical protein JWR19_3227 [Pedosphaera sp.]|nr:hypothetical protein [Pedosphaera sp.]
MKTNWKRTAFVTILPVLFFILPGRAATFSTNSLGDAFVTTGPSGNLSANNYGGAGVLGVAAPGEAKGEFQSALQFNSAGAFNLFNSQYGAGQWSLLSVTLKLTAAPTNNAIFNPINAGQFKVSWMQNNSWVEGSGTPQTPGVTGVTFNSLQNSLVNGAVDEDLGTFSFGGATSGANT